MPTQDLVHLKDNLGNNGTIKYTTITNKRQRFHNDTLFRVILQNATGHILNLTYNLVDHSVTRKFIRLIKETLQNKHEVQYVSWGVFPAGDESKRQLIRDLRKNMDYFNDNNKANMNNVGLCIE